MINWPENLFDMIARRKCILFLGAGISANSSNGQGKRPATWEQFLISIVKKRDDKLHEHDSIIQRLINEKDYLTACEIIVDVIGEAVFGELAADEFRRPGYKPSEIHRLIYALDSRIVITPNIDKIYEQYATHESNSTVVVKSYYEEDIAKYLRTNDYLIIRAHGQVDDNRRVIFTHKQYSEARNKYSSFYKLLDALILTHTFVFLGCGINDPDIKLTLENSNFLYPNCLPHYFITAEDTYESDIEAVLRNNRNLELLKYENSDGKHTKLQEELQRLTEIVDEKRIKIMENQTW